jgi:halocyanin-like protein
VAATGLLAGCSGGNDGGDGSGDGGDGTDGSDGGDGGSGSSDGGVPSEAESYLSNAKNYNGGVDKTGSDAVTVEVGAGSGLAFGPAAVRISTGTTVTWEWVQGSHNVVAEDGTFDSGGLTTSGPFEHTFESSGVYNYYCEPHKQSGMKGAIIVE